MHNLGNIKLIILLMLPLMSNGMDEKKIKANNKSLAKAKAIEILREYSDRKAATSKQEKMGKFHRLKAQARSKQNKLPKNKKNNASKR